MLGIGLNPEHPQSRPCARVFRCGLCPVAARLIEVARRNRAEIKLTLLALQILLSQLQRVRGFVGVVIGLGQVRSIEGGLNLSLAYPVTQCNPDLQDTTCQRGQHGSSARWI